MEYKIGLMQDTPEEQGLMTNIRHRVESLVLDEADIALRDENKELLAATPFKELEPKLETLIDRQWNIKDVLLGKEEISSHPDILTSKEGEKFKKFVRSKRFGKAINYLQNHAGMIGQKKLNEALKPPLPTQPFEEDGAPKEET